MASVFISEEEAKKVKEELVALLNPIMKFESSFEVFSQSSKEALQKKPQLLDLFRRLSSLPPSEFKKFEEDLCNKLYDPEKNLSKEELHTRYQFIYIQVQQKQSSDFSLVMEGIDKKVKKEGSASVQDARSKPPTSRSSSAGSSVEFLNLDRLSDTEQPDEGPPMEVLQQAAQAAGEHLAIAQEMLNLVRTGLTPVNSPKSSPIAAPIKSLMPKRRSSRAGLDGFQFLDPLASDLPAPASISPSSPEPEEVLKQLQPASGQPIVIQSSPKQIESEASQMIPQALRGSSPSDSYVMVTPSSQPRRASIMSEMSDGVLVSKPGSRADSPDENIQHKPSLVLGEGHLFLGPRLQSEPIQNQPHQPLLEPSPPVPIASAEQKIAHELAVSRQVVQAESGAGGAEQRQSVRAESPESPPLEKSGQLSQPPRKRTGSGSESDSSTEISDFADCPSADPSKPSSKRGSPKNAGAQRDPSASPILSAGQGRLVLGPQLQADLIQNQPSQVSVAERKVAGESASTENEVEQSGQQAELSTQRPKIKTRFRSKSQQGSPHFSPLIAPRTSSRRSPGIGGVTGSGSPVIGPAISLRAKGKSKVRRNSTASDISGFSDMPLAEGESPVEGGSPKEDDGSPRQQHLSNSPMLAEGALPAGSPLIIEQSSKSRSIFQTGSKDPSPVPGSESPPHSPHVSVEINLLQAKPQASSVEQDADRERKVLNEPQPQLQNADRSQLGYKPRTGSESSGSESYVIVPSVPIESPQLSPQSEAPIIEPDILSQAPQAGSQDAPRESRRGSIASEASDLVHVSRDNSPTLTTRSLEQKRMEEATQTRFNAHKFELIRDVQARLRAIEAAQQGSDSLNIQNAVEAASYQHLLLQAHRAATDAVEIARKHFEETGFMQEKNLESRRNALMTAHEKADEVQLTEDQRQVYTSLLTDELASVTESIEQEKLKQSQEKPKPDLAAKFEAVLEAIQAPVAPVEVLPAGTTVLLAYSEMAGKKLPKTHDNIIRESVYLGI